MADRVFALVVEQTGVPRGKPNLESRLSFDLGIEGDDAVELFDAFKSEFTVDISELHLFWDSHFAREGVSLGTAIIFGAPIILVALVLSNLFPGWPAWLNLLLGVTASFAGLFGWAALMRRPGQNEITIAELIEAAESGQFRVKTDLKECVSTLSGS